MWPVRLHLETKTPSSCNVKPFSCFLSSLRVDLQLLAQRLWGELWDHTDGAGLLLQERLWDRPRRKDVQRWGFIIIGGRTIFFVGLHLVPVYDLEFYWARCYLCMSFTWGMRPSVASVAQILMSAVCMGPAASPVPTLMAATPAPVWKDICLSRTIAPARPRMVRTCDRQRIRAYATSARFVLSPAAASQLALRCPCWEIAPQVASSHNYSILKKISSY